MIHPLEYFVNSCTFSFLQPLHDMPHGVWVGVFVVLGLVVGSFVNVVIYRLPRIMEAQAQADYTEWLYQTQNQTQNQALVEGGGGGGGQKEVHRFNLAWPSSHCPHCQAALAWYENIPVVSYLFQKGRCRHCQTPISKQYILVELSMALLFGALAYGSEPCQTLPWIQALWVTMLMALIVIDWQTFMLPDDLTLPLMWWGLVVAALGWGSLPLQEAFWGAVVGYLSLWSIFWLFKGLTGKEGMGYGDFKLFAALGAWHGALALPMLVLWACGLGILTWLLLKFSGHLNEQGYIPFGPSLALAGLLGLWVQPSLMGFIG